MRCGEIDEELSVRRYFLQEGRNKVVHKFVGSKAVPIGMLCCCSKKKSRFAALFYTFRFVTHH